MPAPVVSDAAHASVNQVGYLVLPHRGAQRRTVDEDNWLPRAPVLVTQVCAISGLDKWHHDKGDEKPAIAQIGMRFKRAPDERARCWSSTPYVV